jgi:hypothetical protein
VRTCRKSERLYHQHVTRLRHLQEQGSRPSHHQNTRADSLLLPSRPVARANRAFGRCMPPHGGSLAMGQRRAGHGARRPGPLQERPGAARWWIAGCEARWGGERAALPCIRLRGSCATYQRGSRGRNAEKKSARKQQGRAKAKEAEGGAAMDRCWREKKVTGETVGAQSLRGGGLVLLTNTPTLGWSRAR